MPLKFRLRRASWLLSFLLLLTIQFHSCIGAFLDSSWQDDSEKVCTIHKWSDPTIAADEQDNILEIVNVLNLAFGHNPYIGYATTDEEDEWMNTIVNTNTHVIVEENENNNNNNNNNKKLHQNHESQRPSTYGEITSLGARQLFHAMGLLQTRHQPSSYKKDDDVDDVDDDSSSSSFCLTFLDMGSGIGKLVLQSYMEYLPNVCHVMGIELSPTRHKAAIEAWERVQEEATHVRQHQRQRRQRRRRQQQQENDTECTVELVQGNFLELDITNVTHIYLSSLCFTNEMMFQLGNKLMNEGNNLQVVATLRSFPAKFTSFFGEPASDTIEMSWTHTSPINIYRILQKK